jgi:tellurite resistance protein TerC
MNISIWVWAVTLLVLVGVLFADLMIIGRRPHEPRLREATLWVVFYVALAALFGLWIWAGYGATYAGEFYAGWLVEYSLSTDNLFVFLLIMSSFAVPRHLQQKVLMIGIIMALVLRAVFIAAGAVLVSQFIWVFYLFGLFLVYTGLRLVRHKEADEDAYHENALVRAARRVLPMSRGYPNGNLTIVENGKRLFTPLLVVMVAIGTTDVVFAVDSIPAIFGVTREPYLVFAANVFALMGLRQLYFLIGGLVNRLIYLSQGLAIVLCFIGVKMVLEALAENDLPFINGGEHVEWAPHIPIWFSLAFIIATLGITALISMAKSARDRKLSETRQ